MISRRWVPAVAVLLLSSLLSVARAQSSFHLEVVAAPGDVGRNSSLALDAAGNPHITCQNVSAGRVTYARRSEGPWVLEDLGFGEVTSNRALGLDSQDVPHVAMGVYYGAVIASRSPDGVWSQAVAGGYATWWAALAIGGDDVPHIAYMWSIGSGTYQGWLAYDRGDIAPNLFVPSNPGCSLAMGPAGDAHIVATMNEPDPMRYLAKGTGNWTEETLPVGSWPAIALDASNFPRIAFYDPSAHDLIYGRRGEDGWHFETVDAAGDVGKYPSLALDAAGGVHITYYDAGSGDLKYAARAAGAAPWGIFTVDAGGDVGEWSSLRVTDPQAVRVSYYDRTNGDLKFASSAVPVAAERSTLGRVKALYRTPPGTRP